MANGTMVAIGERRIRRDEFSLIYELLFLSMFVAEPGVELDGKFVKG